MAIYDYIFNIGNFILLCLIVGYPIFILVQRFLNDRRDDFCSALRTAVISANWQDVVQCLKDGMNPDIQDNSGDTALIIAAKQKFDISWQCVDVLLKAKANPNIQSLSGNSAIQIAISCGNLKSLQLLLDAGAIVENRNDKPFDAHPLIMPVLRGHVEVVEDMIRRCADVNMKTNYGVPILMAAISARNIDCVQMLLDAGANPNIRDGDGFTALRWAVEHNQPDIIKLLLRAGADVNDGSEISQWNFPYSEKTIYGGDTALICAVKREYGRCLTVLLEEGADPNIKNESGNTALLQACATAYSIHDPKTFLVECVQLLLEAGADVNTKDEYKRTALMWTVFWGYKECVQLLLEAGADVNNRDISGKTILELAIEHDDKECIQLLRQAGAKE